MMEIDANPIALMSVTRSEMGRSTRYHDFAQVIGLGRFRTYRHLGALGEQWGARNMHPRVSTRHT